MSKTVWHMPSQTPPAPKKAPVSPPAKAAPASDLVLSTLRPARAPAAEIVLPSDVSLPLAPLVSPEEETEAERPESPVQDGPQQDEESPAQESPAQESGVVESPAQESPSQTPPAAPKKGRGGRGGAG